MRKTFTEALGDLLAEYTDMDVEDVIADIEMHLDGLRDDLAQKRADKGE